MHQNLQQFLLEEQRHAVQQQIITLSQQLKLPAKPSIIRQRVFAIQIMPAILQIDPERLIYLSRLLEANEEAVTERIVRVFTELMDWVQLTINVYIEEENLRYLGRNYFNLLRQQFNLPEWTWKFLVKKQQPLWHKLCQEVRQLLAYTIQRIASNFQLSGGKEEQLVQIGLNLFSQKVGKHKKNVQNSQKGQGITASLNRLKQPQDSQIANLIQQLQDYEEQLQVQEEIQLINSLEKCSNQEKYSFRVADNRIFPQKIRESTTKNEQKQEKEYKNIEYLITLSQAEKQFLQQISLQDEFSLLNLLKRKFSTGQKQRVLFAFKKPFLEWQADGPFCLGEEQLVEHNKLKLYSLKNSFQKLVQPIECGESQCNEKYFILVSFLYKVVESEYCTLTKKYLMKIMEVIEGQFNTRTYPYLRGALRVLETSTIKPSKFAQKLELSAPYRSKQLQYQLNYQLISQEQQDQLTLESSEVIRLQRLSHAKPTKNVAFLISGFLSEDTEKDLQWLGAIRSLEETELYGVLWRSSSKAELIKYIATLAGSVALEVAKKTQPGFLVAISKIGVDLFRKITKIEPEKQQNPFFGALSRATEAGRVLANYLIDHFSDRHISLFGFSMGTQVIKACVQHLIQRKKQSLLLKVVTLGGVAKRDQVQTLLRRSKYPLSWLNFRSKKDYAVRFLFRVCTFGAKPIGSVDIGELQGHQILNWEMGKVVSGHMDFRNNLYGLCLMAGIRHD